jgi:hypothetical protein
MFAEECLLNLNHSSLGAFVVKKITAKTQGRKQIFNVSFIKQNLLLKNLAPSRLGGEKIKSEIVFL